MLGPCVSEQSVWDISVVTKRPVYSSSMVTPWEQLICSLPKTSRHALCNSWLMFNEVSWQNFARESFSHAVSPSQAQSARAGCYSPVRPAEELMQPCDTHKCRNLMWLCSRGSLRPDGLIALEQTVRWACVVSSFQNIYFLKIAKCTRSWCTPEKYLV